jgi:hypothetical protein
VENGAFASVCIHHRHRASINTITTHHTLHPTTTDHHHHHHPIITPLGAMAEMSKAQQELEPEQTPLLAIMGR